MLGRLVSVTSLHDIFSRTADAVFVIDSRCEIVYQNEVFADTFQPHGLALPHRKCYELVCRRSLDRNRCCDPDCPVGKTVLNGQVTENFELAVPQDAGSSLCFSVGTLPAHKLLGKAAAVVMLRPLDVPKVPASKRESNQPKGGSAPDIDHKLTRREQQILNLLAKGLNSGAIANALYINRVTVRNHIQHIYAKLGIHSRAEAISYIFRKDP